MNSVIIDIELLRYILNSQYKIISIYLITRYHEQRDYSYWTITIYLYSKYKIISIYLITRFHKQRNYRYWKITIYFQFKI